MQVDELEMLDYVLNHPVIRSEFKSCCEKWEDRGLEHVYFNDFSTDGHVLAIVHFLDYPVNDFNSALACARNYVTENQIEMCIAIQRVMSYFRHNQDEPYKVLRELASWDEGFSIVFHVFQHLLDLWMAEWEAKSPASMVRLAKRNANKLAEEREAKYRAAWAAMKAEEKFRSENDVQDTLSDDMEYEITSTV